MLGTYLVAIASVLGVIIYIIHRKKQKYLEEKLEAFPGPPLYPLIGNAHLVLGSPVDIMKIATQFPDNYKSPMKAWIMHVPAVLIYDPENFQIVSNEALTKAFNYDFIKILMGEGLITSNGPTWRRKRKALDPVFNVTLLSNYFLDIFNESNKLLIQELAEKVTSGEEFDLWTPVMKYNGRSILRNAMKVQLDDKEDGANEEKMIVEYSEAVEEALQLVIRRMLRPWLFPNLFFNLYSRILGKHKFFRLVRCLPLKVLEKKSEEFKNGYPDAISSRPLSAGKMPKSFIEALFNSEAFKDADHDALVDEIITFISTGSETSAITICFTLLMLAMNPQIQVQVYKELKMVLGDEDRPANLTELNQLTLMEQCIHETLRRFPPAPFILRQVHSDIMLKDGRVIPAGTVAALCIYLLHIDNNIYENPLEWNPKRFLPEEVKKRHPSSFVPFSTGPRSCIGQKYAMLAVKAQLAALLQSFSFTTRMKMEDITLGFDMAIRNTTGFNVRIQRRLSDKSSL